MNNQALLIIPTIDDRPVSIAQGAIQKREEALAIGKKVTQVTNVKELQLSVNSDSILKAVENEAGDACELFKGPFYRIYKKIMAMTEEFTLPITTERKRQKKLRDDFATAEQKRVDDENARLEQERLAAEKRAAAALAEQERIANLAKPQPKKEVAAEVKVQEAVADLQKTQAKAPAVVARAAGYSVKKVLKFEITDKRALYAARPEFFELVEKRSVINAAITKETNLPGLTVWEQIETGTRG